MKLEIETDTPLLQIGTKLSLSSLFSLLNGLGYGRGSHRLAEFVLLSEVQLSTVCGVEET